MRRSTSRPTVFAWLAIAALAVFASGPDVRAQSERESNAHAGADEHAVDHAHGETDTGHRAEEHDSAVHDDHGGVDYSQPPMFFDPKLFFWSLGLFVLFLFVARKFAWTPLIEGLDAREARVNRALHDAEAARVEAERLLAERQTRMDRVQEEVKDIVAAARRTAEAEKAKIIAEADAEATALRDLAVADIKAAHQQAINDLDARIDQQVTVATEHVLGSTV